MSRSYVYMNETMRELVPSRPPIVVQTGRKVVETGRAQLVVDGKVIGEVRFEPDGLDCAPHHHVRAFVELEDGVEVRYPEGAS